MYINAHPTVSLHAYSLLSVDQSTFQTRIHLLRDVLSESMRGGRGAIRVFGNPAYVDGIDVVSVGVGRGEEGKTRSFQADLLSLLGHG